ncbi:phosphotransferase [Heliobacillus mobilis]|uniref:Phosphotransferase n=1 Tax=Heliobacterium mobile TaxID=28064 RepID=A0A6I3SK46_HELMO|nr:phosphotransferase [Heliobacterium mobile]MTV49291.1 phosphotransferase [Heliobacterium mobile]
MWMQSRYVGVDPRFRQPRKKNRSRPMERQERRERPERRDQVERSRQVEPRIPNVDEAAFERLLKEPVLDRTIPGCEPLPQELVTTAKEEGSLVGSSQENQYDKSEGLKEVEPENSEDTLPLTETIEVVNPLSADEIPLVSAPPPETTSVDDTVIPLFPDPLNGIEANRSVNQSVSNMKAPVTVMEDLERLPDREAIEQVLLEHDMKMQNVLRQGDRRIIETDQGSIVIETVNGPHAFRQIQNVIHALRHLQDNGFPHCPNPLFSKYGETVIPWEDRAYYIYPKISGRTVKLESTRDFREAGRALGLLHRSGRGFQSLYPGLREEDSSLSRFREGKEAAERWLEKVQSQRFFSDADRLLRDDMPKLTERAEKAFAWVEEVYQARRKQVDEEGAFCHGRYGTEALLKNHQGFWVEQFNDCRSDVPVLDLAEFIAAVTRRSRDGWKDALNVIEGYEWAEKLRQSDWMILLGHLLFPFSLWEYLEQRQQTPSKTIEIIPDRKLQDQGYRRARRAVEMCNRTYVAAYRLAAHSEIELPFRD